MKKRKKKDILTHVPFGLKTSSKYIPKEYPLDALYVNVLQKNIILTIGKYVFNSEQWNRFYFQKYQYTNSQRREMRKLIMVDTVICLLRGKYFINDGEIIKKIPLNKKAIEKSVQNTTYYNNEYQYKLNTEVFTDTEILIVRGDCLAATLKLIEKGYNPCCLIMASRSNPGGGYEKGARAQEESLCRRSNLFMCLDDVYGMDPKRKWSYPHPEFGGIYCRPIVFRQEEEKGYGYLESSLPVPMLTQYSYAHPPLDKNGRIEGGKLINKYLRKIEVILSIALENNHDSIVLSAFGAGVHSNPPKHIAEMFKSVLKRKKFRNKFKRVVFAIIEFEKKSKNLEEFSKVFGKKVLLIEEIE